MPISTFQFSNLGIWECFWNLHLFAGFRISQQGASVWLPAALRLPQKKYPFGVLEHVPCVFLLILLVFYIILSIFLPVLGSPSRVRLCDCLRRFADLRKTRPWNFGACTLCVLSILVVFVQFKYHFAGFGVSQQGASVWLPAALRRPRKQKRPCNFGACILSILLLSQHSKSVCRF